LGKKRMIRTNRSFDETWCCGMEEEEKEYGPQGDCGLVTTNGGTIYFLKGGERITT
jgi:hypothetical protein